MEQLILNFVKYLLFNFQNISNKLSPDYLSNENKMEDTMLKKLFVITLGIILLISCGGPQKDASGYWESANALADVGNFEGAIDQYNKIIKYY